MLLLKHFIVQVACGSYHTLCLTREGVVWGFGKNKNGQIGTGTTRHVNNILGANNNRQCDH
jgi:alpha-tubulin suppressor-like RCC1 family protein